MTERDYNLPDGERQDEPDRKFTDDIEKFVHALAESDHSDIVAGKAFGLIADTYRIGKVCMKFSTPPTPFTKDGDRREFVLFSSAAENDTQIGYDREFHTGEGGRVEYALYRTKGTDAFSEEEKRMLDVIMEIMFFHCGRWRLINQVKKIAHTDSLTGLPNSGGFLTYVDELLAKNQLTQYNAYYFNLTRFSLVNKQFGTKETDTIIARYSKALMDHLEEGECIGRLGGDNFVALIRKEHTDAFLEMLSGLETYGMLGGRKIPVVISAVAGGLIIDESVTNCGMVIGECAMALNVARHVDKKPYVFVSEEVRQQIYREKQIAGGFMEALQNGAFRAYYQPKVETDSYRIVGAEALARLEYEGKLVPPMEFVPVLERNGMVCALDFYILEQVCKDIRGWLREGIEPVRVSVNLSRKHLANPHLCEDIMSIIGKYELESKYIELELTETVEESETNRIISFMKQMKQHQVALSIDDFGTGYSSLNLLRSFPVDVLKLDRTFMSSMEETDRIVLSNIVRMAADLHMDVVAEGVENWQQVDYLKQIACNVVQGFLFDKPLPKTVFEEKLKAGKYEIE
ncbi:MAG: EAL domain-containing protein [Eubacterium sp.]|nr:EAL domain-containing protein [Eubacterium sp.]